MNRIVLITEPEFLKADAIFKSAADLECEAAPGREEELARRVSESGARAVVVGVAPYQGPLYAALGAHGPALIARFGVGHDNLDKTLARRHRILITNTPGVLDQSVAEHTLWLMGCLARQVAQSDARLRAGHFHSSTGCELHGKTLGILGLGGIGRRVAHLAHQGLGMRVLAAGRAPRPPQPAGGEVDLYTDNAGLVLRQCDVLSIHLRSDETTRHFMNAERLGWLKPSALLVNTSRGAVVDEAALYDALVAGRLAGAALDVFEREPYEPAAAGKDLRTLPNVVLTPHAGSNTREANYRMAEAALANVRHFLAGKLDLLTQVT